MTVGTRKEISSNNLYNCFPIVLSKNFVDLVVV